MEDGVNTRGSERYKAGLITQLRSEDKNLTQKSTYEYSKKEEFQTIYL